MLDLPKIIESRRINFRFWDENYHKKKKEIIVRRFFIFIAAGLLLISLRVYSNGLRRFHDFGEYSYFSSRDEEIYSDAFRLVKGYDKLSVCNADHAERIISDLNATEIFSERLNDVVVKYYYSPYMGRSVTVKNKRVSLMTAQRSDGTVILGAPLLKGCY